MKKINNKGFTLVELLVVIVILLVIVSIAIPSISSSLERSKQKQKDAKIKLIISAAEIYVDRNKNSLIPNGYGSYVIWPNDLIDAGLLTQEEAKDPLTEAVFDGCILFETQAGDGYYSRDTQEFGHECGS